MRRSCSLCGKSIRGESGLAWHMQEIHGSTQAAEPEPVDESASRTVVPDDQLEALRQTVEGVQVELGAVVSSVRGIDDRLRPVEGSVGRLDGASRQQDARLDELARHVATLTDVCKSMALLIVFDQERRADPMGFRALMGTPPEVTHARELLTSFVGRSQPSASYSRN